MTGAGKESTDVEQPSSERPMPEPANRERLLDVIGLLARLVLGVVLLVAGALKVGDPANFASSIMAYQLPGLSLDMANFLGAVMPLVEILVGLLLVLGLMTRTSAGLGVLLMLVFIVLIASVWARGISIDCGCFSKGGETDDAFRKYPWEIARDLGLALCGAWLLWRPRSLFSLDRRLFG